MKALFHPKSTIARFAFAIVLFVLACWFSCSPLVAAEKPNIIFLLTDDQTALAAGCYGNTEIQTPNIDRLARDGVRFSNHYNTTSVCMASRCCLMTGLYEYRHGCNFGHGDLERRFMDQSYPVLLRKAGYFTGFAGKIGFQIQGEPFEAFASLFDQWAGGPGQTFYETQKNAGIAKYADQYPHCSRAYGAWAVDFLKAARQSGKPFCLSISFKAPHMPFTPDPLDTPLYEGKRFTRPPNYGVANAAYLSPQSRTSRAFTSYRFWITDYDKTLAAYYALIAGVDAALGTIREELEREGFADNTIIIFTSDNGYNCGAHGFGDKVLPYEEASKSPLLIYDPRLPKGHAGNVSAAVTGNVDMAPTILALAGVPAPDNLDGRNLLPLLANPGGQVRDFLPLFNFWGIESAQSMAVVSPEWKFIYWYYGGKDMTPVEELFHVGLDRFELQLVTAGVEHGPQVETMRRYYDTQLDHITHQVVQGHGYEPYPTLFNRAVVWSEKVPLLKPERGANVAERGKRGKKRAEPADE